VAFRLLDADNDGFISRKEFSSFVDAIRRTLTRIGIQNENISSLVDLFFSSASAEAEASSNLPQISTQRTRKNNVLTTKQTHNQQTANSNLTTTNSADSRTTTTTTTNTTTLNNSTTKSIDSKKYNTDNKNQHNNAALNNSTASTQSSLPISHRKTPPPSNVSTSSKTSPLKGASSPFKTPPLCSLSQNNTSIMSSSPNIKSQPKEQTSKVLQNAVQLKGSHHKQTVQSKETTTTTTTNGRISNNTQRQTQVYSQLAQSPFLQRVRPQYQPCRVLVPTKDAIDFECFKMIAVRFKDVIESLGRLDAKNICPQKEDYVYSSNSPSPLSLTQSSNKLNFMNDVNNIVYDNKHYNLYKSQNANRGLFVAFGNEQWELTQYILLGLWKLVRTLTVSLPPSCL
jgi:hypothetical protein